MLSIHETTNDGEILDSFKVDNFSVNDDEQADTFEYIPSGVRGADRVSIDDLVLDFVNDLEDIDANGM